MRSLIGRPGRTAPAGRRTARQGFAFTAATLGTLFAVTLYAQLPAAVVPSALHRQQQTYRTIWPQGWGFFANTADLPGINVLDVAPDGLPEGSVLSPFVSSADLWGLKRGAQMTVDEALHLADEIPSGAWVSCDTSALRSCPAGARLVRIGNGFKPRLICGRKIFLRSPAATAGYVMEAGRGNPVSAALVDVSCAA